MNHKYLGAGALFAAFSVVFGAFGAHQLKEIVAANDLVTWETACRYQLVHALALLLISQIGVGNKHIKWAGIYFMIGIFLFLTPGLNPFNDGRSWFMMVAMSTSWRDCDPVEVEPLPVNNDPDVITDL